MGKVQKLCFCCKVALWWFICVLPGNLQGQDIQFTQFYMASNYLNPGFTGSFHYPRVFFQQRLQWPGLDAKYTTSMAGFDTYSKKFRSGIGASVIYDWQSNAKMSSREVQLQYAYEVPISEKLVFRPGLQVGLVSKSLDDTKLTFPDQFDQYGYVGQTKDNLPKESIFYPDISAGALLYSEKVWFGASMHHINRPDVSFFENQSSRWPVKYALVGGIRIVAKNISGGGYINDDLSIVPTFHYKSQGKSDQLDIGTYLNYQFLVLGFWYRGIPLLKYYLPDLQNNESVAVLIGVRAGRWRAGYSYDFVVSRLVPAKPDGAHEISLSYTFSPLSDKKKWKRLPCPEF